MSSTLLWFRRDLRLHDLPPLLVAAADGGADVLACFVARSATGDSPSGPRRLQFLVRLAAPADATTSMAGC